MRHHFLRAALGGVTGGGGGGGYDADVQAWMDARDALSDPVPTAYADAVNQYVLDLKAISGLWDSITQLVVFAGATTVNGGLVPIKGLTPTHSNLTAGDFGLKTGVKGNGSNIVIQTGYTHTDFDRDNMHTYALLTELPTSNTMRIFGNGGTSSGSWSIVINSGTGNSASRCRQNTADSGSGATVGGYGISRSNSTTYWRMFADNTAEITRGPQTTNASPYYLLATSSNASSTASGHSDARVLVWAIGLNRSTLSDYTTPGNDLITALNAI